MTQDIFLRFSWYFLQYFEKISELHKILRFLLDRIKIEKTENFVFNLHDWKEYVVEIRTFEKNTKSWIIIAKGT